MSAYGIVEFEVTDLVGYEQYKKTCAPSIAKYGGKHIACGEKHCQYDV
jgi:uncharacterized protein (DUF1330 family)